MTAVPTPDFSGYLRSIVDRYKEWWKIDGGLTKTIVDRQATFTFEQQVQTEEKSTGEAASQQDRTPRKIPLPLISGIQTYAKTEPVLVVGSPGVGKTSALLRCLLEYAKQELLKPEHEQRIPVLIRLKNYQKTLPTADDPSGMLALIRNTLKPRLKRRIEIAEVEDLLFQERLVLLLDGLNELPLDENNYLRSFCEDFDQTPLICSTRELGSDALGITRKLVIQPPAPKEIDRFLNECIPAESRRKVEDFLNQDRRELSRTPFVLWMLYHVVQETDNVAATLGGVFRKFFQSFKGRPEAAPVPEKRRQAWDEWLKHLAFTMFSFPDPLDPGLTIPIKDAQEVLFQEFPAPHESPSLSELLKYHLLQQENNDISFQHQLVQEYYAAEALVDRLESKLEDKKIPDDEFKHYYLNYLRWTEPIALMLSLLEEKNDREALQIVQWALDIDLMLGARLAGAVRSGLQGRSVEWVNGKEVPSVLKIRLLGATKSDYAIEPLLAFLINKIDQDLILSSAFGLREINSIKIIAKLQNALESDNEIVVIAAILILKGLGNEAAPYLKAALNHPNEKVREQAVEGLGALNDRTLVPELLKILRDKNESERVRNKATEVLGELGDELAFSDLLEAALEDRFEFLSGMAAKALGKVNQERAIEALINALNHKNVKIRRKAADALGQIGNQTAIDGLISALETDVRQQAAQALVNLDNKAAIPKLLESLLHPNPSVQECAIFVLRELGDQAAVPGLLHALKYGCPSTREITIETLGVIGDETVIPELKPFLNDLSFAVRENAVIALGTLGDESIRPELLSLLKELSVSYRRGFHHLFKALEKVANSEVLDGLLNALKAQNYRLRLHVVNLLEKVGNEQIIPELIESLRDEHPSVRFYTQQAIGRLGNQTVLPQLYQLLASSDAELRKAAIGAVKALGDNDASVRELIKQLEDQDLSVCMSAVDALGEMKNIQALPHLWTIYCQGKVECLSAIEAIQADCKFYSYEVYERTKFNKEPVPMNIDFAILTAIAPERKAICEAFEITDDDRIRQGSRTYWYKRLPLKKGKFYEIIVAQSLDMANVNAALLASDTLHHWRPSAVLMVGIAATATSKQKLGDIVVGKEAYYYELGKITADGKLPEPKQIPADATLLDRAQALPEVDFPILVDRPDQKSTHPQIEIAVIASGDKVISDAAERDKIAAVNRKIRAIEMEGYGVMNATWQSFDQVRCLVIRALCDYADSTKNDEWHQYAAAAAAGFTKHFLLDEPLEPRNSTDTKNQN